MARGTLGNATFVLTVAVLAASLGIAAVASQTGDQAVEVSGCRSIGEPGSYRLAANVTAQASPCLSIGVDDVLLDGDGHGVSASGDPAVGIRVGADGEQPTNVTVQDVTVDGFATSGVEVDDARSILLQRVTARGADGVDGAGIRVQASADVVVGSALVEANTLGIVGQGTTELEIDRAQARANLVDGIRLADAPGTLVVDSRAADNGEAGVHLVRSGDATVLRGSLARNPTGVLADASPAARLVEVEVQETGRGALEATGGDRVLLDRVGFGAWELSGQVRDAQLGPTTVIEAPPSPHAALDLQLEASPSSPGAFVNLTGHYPAQTVPDHEEETMRWWRWTGTEWTTVDGPNRVDVAQSSVTTNVTRGGVYGPVVEQDLTPPRTTHEAPSGWVDRAVQLALEAEDEASGVAETRYRVDGGAWTVYEAPVELEAEGRHEVDYHSTDGAGNEEPVRNATVRIDTTPPSTRVEVTGTRLPDGRVQAPATVSLPAEDALSGVRDIMHRLDGGPWRVDEAPFALTAPGEHTLAVRSVDEAGNREPVQEVAVEVVDPDEAASGETGAGGGGSGPVEMLVEEDGEGSGDQAPGEAARVRVVNASEPERLRIVLVHPDGEQETLGEGATATWPTGDYPNGPYVLEARREADDGSSATVASDGYLVEHARASPLEALGAVAAGVALFATARAAGAGAGRLVRWLRYLVKTVRRALGIEYRERTKEHTTLRERLAREGGAVLVAAGILAAAVTLAGIQRWVLDAFLSKLPLLGGAAVAFSLVWYGGDWLIARLTGQRPRYVLLGAGLASLAVSTAVFRSPFGTPGYVDKQGDPSPRDVEEEAFFAHRTLADLGLIAAASLLFLPMMRWVSYGFGEAGLLLVVMTLATGAVPVAPLPAHQVWRWSKPAAGLALGGGVGVYVAWQLALLPDPALAALGLAGVGAVAWFAARYGSRTQAAGPADA